MEEKDINEQTVSEVESEKDEELVSDIGGFDEDDPIESEEPIEETPVGSATEAPEPGAKPKKKKFAKWKIALICVAAFFALIGIGVGIFFWVGAVKSHSRQAKHVDFYNAPPAYAVSFTASELSLIEDAMAANASEDTIKAAIAAIYARANDNKINHTPSAVTVLRGEGSAAIEVMNQKPSGSMIVRGFKVQAGNEFYYQKAAPIMTCSVPKIQWILEEKLNQQERLYSDGVSDFRATGSLKGDAAKISDEDEIETETIPFVKVGIPDEITVYADKASLYESAYYLEDPREITNFKIVKDTIVLKPLADGEKYIEYDEEGEYYICRFSLLIEGEGHDECVGKSRQYLRDSADSNNLEYGRFDIVLEVWKNGYLKMMHDDEKWEGTIKLGGTTTSSTSYYESIVFYDYDEKLFSEEDREKYAGEDWAAKLIANYKAELDSKK